MTKRAPSTFFRAPARKTGASDACSASKLIWSGSYHRVTEAKAGAHSITPGRGCQSQLRGKTERPFM